jgi:hypothetical protein
LLQYLWARAESIIALGPLSSSHSHRANPRAVIGSRCRRATMRRSGASACFVLLLYCSRGRWPRVATREGQGASSDFLGAGLASSDFPRAGEESICRLEGLPRRLRQSKSFFVINKLIRTDQPSSHLKRYCPSQTGCKCNRLLIGCCTFIAFVRRRPDHLLLIA